MNQQDIAMLLQARADTIAWCELEGKKAALRTAALRPDLPEWPTQAEFDAALSVLCRRRRELLVGRTKTMSRGRLLVCEYNLSISSGESEAETSGFFDTDDRPPWDTWVGRFERDDDEITLLSWIPQEFEALVTSGIEVNPYECIYWFTGAELIGTKHRKMVQALAAGGFE